MFRTPLKQESHREQHGRSCQNFCKRLLKASILMQKQDSIPYRIQHKQASYHNPQRMFDNIITDILFFFSKERHNALFFLYFRTHNPTVPCALSFYSIYPLVRFFAITFTPGNQMHFV